MTTNETTDQHRMENGHSQASPGDDGNENSQSETQDEGLHEEEEICLEQIHSNQHALVQAELVEPPLEAVSVHIDEEHTVSLPPLEAEQDIKEPPQNDCPPWCTKKLFLIMGVTAIIIAVAGGLSTINRRKSVEGNAPTFGYPCFTSTLDMLLVQVDDYLENNQTKDVYIMCPGTTVDIGVIANPADANFEFVGGDYPLWAVAPNTILQCGLDGKRDNRCILNGGFVQAMAQSYIPIKSYEYGREGAAASIWRADLRLDNVTIRGFTFTGLVETVGQQLGSSVVFSQRGDFVVEDCWWTQMTTVNGLVGAYRNDYQLWIDQPYPSRSTNVTVRQSRFDNILFDRPLLLSVNQTLRVEGCTFFNLTVSAIANPVCWLLEADGSFITLEGGCANLMTCLMEASCSFQDSCVEHVESSGPSLLFMSRPENVAGVENRTEGGSEEKNEFEALQKNNYIDDKSRNSSCDLIIRTESNENNLSCTPAFLASQCVANTIG